MVVCLCPLSVDCDVLDPPTGDGTACFLFVVIKSSLSLPSHCLLTFRLISGGPCVGSSAGRILGLIVPANRNLVLGTRHAPCTERMFALFLILFFLFFCSLFPLGVFLVLFYAPFYLFSSVHIIPPGVIFGCK